VRWPGHSAPKRAPINRFAFADPYEAEVLSRPPAIARFGSGVSEFTAEFWGRHYHYVPSGFGKGILLRGVDQLDDVIRRHGPTLAHLGIIPAVGRDNIVDINRLAPLSGLRSLSLGYALNCRDIPATSQFRSLADLRGGGFAAVLDPDDHSAGQGLARDLRSRGGDGLVYPSVRYPAGEAVALFWPDLARAPVQGRHFDYHWNGVQVDLVRDAGSGQVFRIG